MSLDCVESSVCGVLIEMLVLTESVDEVYATPNTEHRSEQANGDYHPIMFSLGFLSRNLHAFAVHAGISLLDMGMLLLTLPVCTMVGG